ncbi:MAG: glycosyltransferase, partial [Nitrospinae bacterium]|nr:glycosyltransferase [Nitrospinota bacterium]
MRPEVSLVIGSYNNGEEIRGTLVNVRAYFEKQPYSHEVIVVNDGSTDGTKAILQEFMPSYPALRVVTNSKNMGKGYSVRRGILEATGLFVFYTDADLAYP